MTWWPLVHTLAWLQVTTWITSHCFSDILMCELTMTILVFVFHFLLIVHVHWLWNFVYNLFLFRLHKDYIVSKWLTFFKHEINCLMITNLIIFHFSGKRKKSKITGLSSHSSIGMKNYVEMKNCCNINWLLSVWQLLSGTLPIKFID